MAKHVGTQPRRVDSPFHCPVDNIVDHLAIERASIMTDEKKFGRETDSLVTERAIAVNNFRELVTKRNYTLFITLSDHF